MASWVCNLVPRLQFSNAVRIWVFLVFLFSSERDMLAVPETYRRNGSVDNRFRLSVKELCERC